MLLNLADRRVGGFGQVSEVFKEIGRLSDEETVVRQRGDRVHRDLFGGRRPDD